VRLADLAGTFEYFGYVVTSAGAIHRSLQWALDHTAGAFEAHMRACQSAIAAPDRLEPTLERLPAQLGATR
jgi:hypothetical protein